MVRQEYGAAAGTSMHPWSTGGTSAKCTTGNSEVSDAVHFAFTVDYQHKQRSVSACKFTRLQVSLLSYTAGIPMCMVNA